MLHLFLLFVFARLSFKANSRSLVPIIRHMNDSYLCNFRELEDHCIYKNGIGKCDTREYDPLSCLSAEITATKFTVNSLLDELPSLDDGTSIRRIVIKTDPIKNFKEIGNEIDLFLTPRPWWSVAQEPYEWKNFNEDNSIVIFERVHEQLESYLRFISSIQYPSQDTCRLSGLHVFTDNYIHPGWGSVLRKLGHSGITSLFILHVIYSSTSNRVTDHTAFIGSDECPEKLNKYECAFLPMTNCTLPKILITCSEFKCVESLNDHYFSNASTEGEVVPEKISFVRNSNFPKNELQESLSKLRKFLMPAVIPWKDIGSERVKREAPNNLLSTISEYMDFALRMNAFMRSKVAKVLSEYREINDLKETERCVGAHVRRGDRMVYGVNMTEWCRDPNSKGKLDKACGGRTFASVRMIDILNHAENLVEPSVRILYVASDDEAWIIHQKKKVRKTHPDWKIVFIPAPIPPANYTEKHHKYHYEGYKYIRSNGGSASGAYFLASLKAMQQCEAMIGHFLSESSGLFYNRMCTKHGKYQGVCPPKFDMATS